MDNNGRHDNRTGDSEVLVDMKEVSKHLSLYSLTYLTNCWFCSTKEFSNRKKELIYYEYICGGFTTSVSNRISIPITRFRNKTVD